MKSGDCIESKVQQTLTINVHYACFQCVTATLQVDPTRDAHTHVENNVPTYHVPSVPCMLVCGSITVIDKIIMWVGLYKEIALSNHTCIKFVFRGSVGIGHD